MSQLPGDNNRTTHPVLNSDQQIQNQSFDRDFNLAVRLMAAYHAVSDTVKRVAADSLGRLEVIVKGFTPTTSVWDEQSSTTVAANALTTVYTRTVTTSDLLIDNITGMGTLDAEYRILIDSTVVERKCSAEQDRNVNFSFPIAQKVSVGSVIEVKVIHYYDGTTRPSETGDFYVSLKGHKD